ncbi:MAG: protoporphyrinogen oxidase [Elusimicrobiota bacterium]
MRSRVVVVGGGVAGLACAYELGKARGDLEVRLLERSERLGGKILSERTGGLVLEGGPDSFITAKPWALELARELGLEGSLVPTSDRNKDVYIYTRGRLRRYPEGLMLLAPTKILPFLASDVVPWTAKLRMGLEWLVPRGDPARDESLGDWARRRFGREALETIVGPVLGGIYAGNPDRLSLASTFPQFKELERRHGSVLRGLRARRRSASEGRGAGDITMFMTLRNGLIELVEALAGRLPPGAAETRREALSLARTPAGRWRFELAGGSALEADAAVLAVQADRAAGLLRSLDGGLADELAGIPFTSTAVVSLGYPAEGFAPPLNGFGFVVDRREARTVVAATFTSTKFPLRVTPDKVLIRCFLGGAGRERTLDMSDGELVGAVRRDLREIMGLDREPETVRVHRWPGANPQYLVGHSARLARITDRLSAYPGLILAGSSYRGVGIPDCVRSGREAARRIAEAAHGTPPAAIV